MTIKKLVMAFAFVCAMTMTSYAQETAQQQSLEANTDRPGSDYVHFPMPARGPHDLWGPDANCQLTCQRDSNCRAFTFAGSSAAGGTCWMKNVIPGAVGSGCCTSGVPIRAFETATDRPGKDYTHFTLPAPDPNQCQAKCAGDTQCQAWTYVNPGIQAPQAMCWLKTPAPAANANPVTTSGVVTRPQPIN
jgi:hypothetical protein